MKLFYCLFLLASIERIGNACLIKAILNSIINVSPSDVTIYYYNQPNIDEPQVVFSLDDVTPLYPYFNVSKETLFVAHGWINGHNSGFAVAVKDNVLPTQNVNFFEIVWPSYTEFVITTVKMVKTGQLVGKFIAHLTEYFNYSHSNVRCAGHSLGAHLCGVAGRNANGTIKSIVGCDPAGTFIFNWETDNNTQLAADQAETVQVIHTTSDTTGLKKSVGHADFWPNGGGSQPGCNFLTNTFGSCSHDRSFQLFADSILKPSSFIAVPYDTNSRTTYNTSERVCMGGYNLDLKAKGDYYLKTAAEAPYGLGTSGIE